MEEQAIYLCMFASIAVSALCSVLEATLLSTPLSYITGLEDQGVKGAKRLKSLKQNTDRPISAILCVNTIANTVGASLVGSLVMKVYGNTLVGIFSAIFTLLILIFSEIIPKTVGSCYWRKLALPASSIINIMIFITFPIVWIMEHLTRIISKNSDQVSVSREDISAMVSVATEEEVIEKEEKKMIQNLLKLDEITAHEIMTPSVVVEMAEGSMTIKEFYELDLTHSRIPVYDEDADCWCVQTDHGFQKGDIDYVAAEFSGMGLLYHFLENGKKDHVHGFGAVLERIISNPEGIEFEAGHSEYSENELQFIQSVKQAVIPTSLFQ